MIFAAGTDDGQVLDEEVAARLLTLPGSVAGKNHTQPAHGTFETLIQERQAAIQRSISERNARFFEAEAEKLDSWADDLKVGLEREIKDLERQIKEARRAATAALTLEEACRAEADQGTRSATQSETAVTVRCARSSRQTARGIDCSDRR